MDITFHTNTAKYWYFTEKYWYFEYQYLQHGAKRQLQHIVWKWIQSKYNVLWPMQGFWIFSFSLGQGKNDIISTPADSNDYITVRLILSMERLYELIHFNFQETGVHLLEIKSPDICKYALTLMDILFKDEEMASSCYQQCERGSASEKPPLSPKRVKLIEGIHENNKTIFNPSYLQIALWRSMEKVLLLNMVIKYEANVIRSAVIKLRNAPVNQ